MSALMVRVVVAYSTGLARRGVSKWKTGIVIGIKF